MTEPDQCDARGVDGPVRVLSFGAGIQTTALAILVAQGKVACDRMIFADTGGELPSTYAHIERFTAWLRGHSWELETVRADAGPLYQYIWERSAVIPVFIGQHEGLGHRQCTRQWKITPILKAAGKPSTMMLGISYDEIHRMKDSPDKAVMREWPLIDMRLTREDCRRIILDAGVREPPNSACYFCPLMPTVYYRHLAVEEPRLFENAAKLEDRMNTRRNGKKPVYLTALGRPLRELQNGQASFLGSREAECEGVCFV